MKTFLPMINAPTRYPSAAVEAIEEFTAKEADALGSTESRRHRAHFAALRALASHIAKLRFDDPVLILLAEITEEMHALRRERSGVTKAERRFSASQQIILSTVGAEYSPANPGPEQLLLELVAAGARDVLDARRRAEEGRGGRIRELEGGLAGAKQALEAAERVAAERENACEQLEAAREENAEHQATIAELRRIIGARGEVGATAAKPAGDTKAKREPREAAKISTSAKGG